MAGVAQVVRALGCGPRGRGFESRHSPHHLPHRLPHHLLHLFGIVLLSWGFASAFGETAPKAPKELKIKIPPSVVDQIITEVPRATANKVPKLTIIVDQFAMREDTASELIAKLSANIVLCVPSHCLLRDHLIEKAQAFGYTLAISLDYLNRPVVKVRFGSLC